MIKEILYKIINFFTFGKGLKKTFNNTHSVRLPTRYVNYFPKDYEKENFDFIKSSVNDGGVVLDIGAHIGLFSLIASQIVGQKGKVFAFEPSPTTFDVLSKTISINNANHIIEPIQKAVGEIEGTIQFFVSNDSIDNSNSLVKYLSDRELKGIDIAITSTDLFVKEKNLRKINFIKIDVEGAELDTLKGAKNTLLTYKPFCMVGIHPEAILAKGDNLLDIYNIIKECGYIILVNNKEISKEFFLENKELIDLHLIPQ
jgi:FkbM family methyltransferase